MRIKHYYFNLTNWQLAFLILLITFPFATFAQQQITNTEETEISGGAEYSQFLEQQKN